MMEASSGRAMIGAKVSAARPVTGGEAALVKVIAVNRTADKAIGGMTTNRLHDLRQNRVESGH